MFAEAGLSPEDARALSEGTFAALERIGVHPTLRMHYQMAARPRSARTSPYASSCHCSQDVAMAELVSAVATSHVLMSPAGAERRLAAYSMACSRRAPRARSATRYRRRGQQRSHVQRPTGHGGAVLCRLRGELRAVWRHGHSARRVSWRAAVRAAFVDYADRRGVAVEALDSLRPDHGTAIPLLFTNADRDAAVVPLLVNYDLAETPSPADCARVATYSRKFIASRPQRERVAIVAAGGLSHWVGYENARINEDFDRGFLDAMRAGELGGWRHHSAAEIRRDAGNGGLEVMSWLLMAAAVPTARAEVVYYEPMPSWMTGMGGVVMHWRRSTIMNTRVTTDFDGARFARPLRVAVAGLLAAATWPVTAIAQTSGSDASVASGAVLEEIIVSARKREESLQDTPISVTAFTAEGIAARGIETTKDLGAHVPNLVANNGSSVSGNNSTGSFFIRGIGQIDFTLNTDPGVGIYVDEVYIARAVGSVMELLDLETVEVLRGPQGTLFGRNTIGGAIQLRSRPPGRRLGRRLTSRSAPTTCAARGLRPICRSPTRSRRASARAIRARRLRQARP